MAASGPRFSRDLGPAVHLACDPSAPADALEQLAGDPNNTIREAVARNPATSAEALEQLAGDKVLVVRRLVAASRSTSTVALGRLAQDKDPEIRRSVARNPRTAPDALARLATDWDIEVRLGAAGHPNVPLLALGTLARDIDREVASTAVAAKRGRAASRAIVTRPAEPSVEVANRVSDGTIAGGLWEQPPSGQRQGPNSVVATFGTRGRVMR